MQVQDTIETLVKYQAIVHEPLVQDRRNLTTRYGAAVGAVRAMPVREDKSRAIRPLDFAAPLFAEVCAFAAVVQPHCVQLIFLLQTMRGLVNQAAGNELPYALQ